MLNRRAFLGTLIGGTVAAAAIQTWPFRVYSFPTDIIIPEVGPSIRVIRAYDLAGMKSMTMRMDYALSVNWRERLAALGYPKAEIVQENAVDRAVKDHFHLTPVR
jgi:hypothetical protein